MTWLLLHILLYSTPIIIGPDIDEIELKITDLEFYEDLDRNWTIDEATIPELQNAFNKDLNFTPQDYNTSAAYWIKLKLVLPDVDKNYLIEFFDQTIDSLDVHVRHKSSSTYTHHQMGDMYPFYKKDMAHKNFQVQLPTNDEYVIYARVVSHEYADIRLAIRSYSRFVGYALVEYYLYGIFYGMILIISLYNLLIYSAIREVKYLYYTFYIISVAVFAMSIDGIAYQYLWPNNPNWNQIAHGVFLFMVIFWAIVFSKKFLNLEARAPKIGKMMDVVLYGRIALFAYALLFDNDLFQYRNIELIPLTLIFVGSIAVYLRGYKPARFFIVAFGFLFLGFILKALLMLSIIPFYILSYYSLHICFVFEMLFLTFALSDRVRILKETRDKAHRRIIEQHEQSARLKDRMNKQLESLVAERTRQLKETNSELEIQKQEIAEINSLLDLDNYRLRNDIKVIQRERIQDKELTYPEFREVFSNKEDCLRALSARKWHKGYKCAKCENDNYSEGNSAFSRRCSKCGYQESPTTNTIFHGIKFPLEKAFFILYDSLHHEEYSLKEMSEVLEIRKNTILDFRKRIRHKSEEEGRDLGQIFTNLDELVSFDKNKL